MYCEIAVGNLRNRGKIIKTSELPKYVKIAQSNLQELYRSYYTYNEEVLDHFKIYNTIKSYKGGCKLERLLFDIDKGVNSDEFTLQIVKHFIDKLNTDWKIDDEEILVWFSGRGYHISVPDVFGFGTFDSNIPEAVKATLGHYFPEADSIYDRTRIIRVGYTINDKSGLYKTPFSVAEITSMSAAQILEKSQTIRSDFSWKPQVGKSFPYSNLILQGKVSDSKNTDHQDGFTNRVTCMQKCYAEGETVGSRHHKMLRMISAYRRAGLPSSAVEILMRNWAKTMDATEVKRLVLDGYKKGYMYGCNDPIMAEFCDKRCIFYKHKNFTMDVTDASGMEQSYRKFINTDFSSSAFNLNEIYVMDEDFIFYPKDFISVLGDTGLGKTALLQNWIINTSLPVLVFSLEVGLEQFWRRMVQIKYGMNKDEVYQHYRSLEDAKDPLAQELSHIRVITTSPNLDDLQRVIAEINPKIVLVDTIEDITVPRTYGADPLDTIGKKLKEIAIQTNTIIFGIHHISKSAAQDSDGRAKSLTVHSGKGASAVEQKADKVISIEGRRDNPYRIIRSQKARDDAPFKVVLEYDPTTFRFIQIPD